MKTQTQYKILMIAASVSLAAMLQLKPEWFIYQRTLMFEQPWRFLSAHWVHVGWIHYLLNMLAFICLPFIFPKIRTWLMVFMMICVPILSSMTFYFFYPKIGLYAGFSGVLHGLYAVAALVSLTDVKERNFALLILLGLSAKLIWEATMGELSATMRLIGSPILIEAHQVGVMIAVMILLLLKIIQKYQPFKLSD